MDDARLRDALLTALRARFTRDWQLDPWEEWLATLEGSELRAEARVLETLGVEDRFISNYRSAVVRHHSPRLTGRVRHILARALVKDQLTHTRFLDTVRGLASLEPDAFVAQVAQLERLGSKPSLKGVHSVLVMALRAIDPSLWPPGPFHRGELRPDIGQKNYPVLANHLADVLHDPELVTRMRTAAEREAAQSRPDMSGSSLRPHTVAVAKALAARDSGSDVTTFLQVVDEALRRLDVVNRVAKRKATPTAPIVRCVWRGDDGKAVRITIAELADGRFGLLAKMRGRYRWIEGSREEVAASVPDAWFPAAMAALARDEHATFTAGRGTRPER